MWQNSLNNTANPLEIDRGFCKCLKPKLEIEVTFEMVKIALETCK